MAEYHLLSTWQIEAPLDEVYGAIYDSLHWPDWWPGLQQAEQTAPGDARGIGCKRRYSWQGDLPYAVTFEVNTTRIENLLNIEGTTEGDLEGTGCWHFRQQDSLSTVQFEWHVRTTKWWWKLLEPVARPMFIRNHGLLMAQGAAGLARRLQAPLRHQESIDLTARRAHSAAPRELHEGGRISLPMLLFAGFWAGVIATGAQLALWWMAERPLLETLFRDARLTAAIVMGPAVLPPPSTAQLEVLLIATLIHFALSVTYALIPATLHDRMNAWLSPLAGALYGLAIYVINLYGFTALFPWFAISRDGATLLTHLVFGVALMEGCRFYARRYQNPGGN